MNLRTILQEKGMSMYRLSKISGVPNTTIIDICSGKSSIKGCSAGTVQKIAQAIGCTMEELMMIDSDRYSLTDGLPKDRQYLELGLPDYLRQSIETMQRSWETEDSGGQDPHWDLYWCELNADINSAETEQEISHEQAQYLRKTYLRMEDNG